MSPLCEWPNCLCKTEEGEPCRFEDPVFHYKKISEIGRQILIEALEKIEEFGHRKGGRGRGYTCANMAKEALDEYRRQTES